MGVSRCPTDTNKRRSKDLRLFVAGVLQPLYHHYAMGDTDVAYVKITGLPEMNHVHILNSSVEISSNFDNTYGVVDGILYQGRTNNRFTSSGGTYRNSIYWYNDDWYISIAPRWATIFITINSNRYTNVTFEKVTSIPSGAIKWDRYIN